jgi:hypothetical protein
MEESSVSQGERTARMRFSRNLTFGIVLLAAAIGSYVGSQPVSVACQVDAGEQQGEDKCADHDCEETCAPDYGGCGCYTELTEYPDCAPNYDFLRCYCDSSCSEVCCE